MIRGMKKNKVIIAIVIAVTGLISFGLPNVSHAQIKGVYRNDLQRHDLGIAGREVVQARVDIDAGVIAPKHSHPGEEIVYLIEGILEYSLEGKAPVRLKAGEVLFIPAGVIHSAKNVGKVKGSELATYIVEKEKPLVTYLK